MNSLRLAAAALACALAVGSAGAQRAATPLRLRDLEAEALRNSPDIRLSAFARDSARAEVRVARALPNPAIASVPNAPFQYTIALPADITAQRTYRVRAASLGATAADLDAGDSRRLVVQNVRHAFFDLVLAREHGRLAAERRAAVLELLRGDSARVRAGEIADHALARTQTELARTDADVAHASTDVLGASTTLELALGRPFPDGTVAVVPLASGPAGRCDADSLIGVAAQHRADLLAAATRVGQAQAARSMVRASIIPVPELTYVYQPAAPFDNGRHGAVGIGLELPVLNQRGGERERASAGVSAASVQHDRVSAQVRRDLVTACRQFTLQRQLLDRFEHEVLTKVDASLAATTYAYQHGAASLVDLLDAQRAAEDVRLDYATALHDCWTAAADLDAAAGVDVIPIDG